MKISKRLLKIAAVSILCLILLVAIGYLLLGTIRSWGIITETRDKIENLSGFNFEIIETNYDRLAKEDWITIFASKVGENKKTVLFEYDPGSYYDLLPTIRVSGDHNITISIRAISSIRFQRHKWQYGSIDYEISHINFPSVEKEECGHEDNHTGEEVDPQMTLPIQGKSVHF